MEGPSRVAGQPSANLRVLVAAVGVGHAMDHLARGQRGLDEADELTVAMPLHPPAKHSAFQDVEGGKQRRGAAASVVVRLSGRMPKS